MSARASDRPTWKPLRGAGEYAQVAGGAVQGSVSGCARYDGFLALPSCADET
jgi:hypothetical protein